MTKQGEIAGLVLTGGGARAAYQAGVVKYISELFPNEASPFKVFTGVSAGAVNIIALAAGAARQKSTAEKVCDIWRNIRHDMVFRSDVSSLFLIGVRVLVDLTVMGRIGMPKASFLLDTSPLRKLIHREVIFSALRLNIRKRIVKGVAISATNYETGTNITFYDSYEHATDWVRNRRISENARISIDHIMASTAIPVFFPPVKIDGGFYGDGSLRLTSPLSPAIHLGAEKILAIGLSSKPEMRGPDRHEKREIFFADIAGLLLNSIFTDSLDSDIERMERVNRSLGYMTEEGRKTHPDRLRPVKLLAIRPSQDLGRFTAGQFGKFPPFLRHLLKGIGVTSDTGGELVSFLAFDKSYTSVILDLGYEDAKGKKDEIREFFEA